MAIQNRYRGNNWFGQWVYPGGTVIISGDQTEFTVDRNTQQIDATAGSETDRAYLNGLGDAKFTLKIYETGAAGSALAAALKNGVAGTLIYGTQGSTAGLPKFSHAANVSNHKADVKFDDKVMLDISFQGTGAWILDYGSVW